MEAQLRGRVSEAMAEAEEARRREQGTAQPLECTAERRGELLAQASVQTAHTEIGLAQVVVVAVVVDDVVAVGSMTAAAAVVVVGVSATPVVAVVAGDDVVAVGVA